MAKKELGWGAAAVLVAVIWYAESQSPDTTSSGSSSQSQGTASASASESSSSTAPTRPIQRYTAAKLYALFHANEIRANQTIGDAIVRFTGAVDTIRQSDFSATPELSIRATCSYVDTDSGGCAIYNTFDADLKESELTAAAALVKGQVITLQCDKVSMPLDILASDCIIVPTAGRKP